MDACGLERVRDKKTINFMREVIHGTTWPFSRFGQWAKLIMLLNLNLTNYRRHAQQAPAKGSNLHSDHTTFIRCSRVQYCCYFANFLVSGFLMDVQPFSLDPLSSLHNVNVKMLSVSQLHSPEFCCFLWFDYTKQSTDLQSRPFRILLTTFLPQKQWFPFPSSL